MQSRWYELVFAPLHFWCLNISPNYHHHFEDERTQRENCHHLNGHGLSSRFASNTTTITRIHRTIIIGEFFLLNKFTSNVARFRFFFLLFSPMAINIMNRNLFHITNADCMFILWFSSWILRLVGVWVCANIFFFFFFPLAYRFCSEFLLPIISHQFCSLAQHFSF